MLKRQNKILSLNNVYYYEKSLPICLQNNPIFTLLPETQAVRLELMNLWDFHPYLPSPVLQTEVGKLKCWQMNGQEKCQLLVGSYPLSTTHPPKPRIQQFCNSHYEAVSRHQTQFFNAVLSSCNLQHFYSFLVLFHNWVIKKKFINIHASMVLGGGTVPQRYVGSMHLSTESGDTRL